MLLAYAILIVYSVVKVFPASSDMMPSLCSSWPSASSGSGTPSQGSMQAKGPKGRVARLPIQAGLALGQAFERAMGLPVSKKKTRVVASSVKLGAQLRRGWQCMDAKRTDQCLWLGSSIQRARDVRRGKEEFA